MGALVVVVVPNKLGVLVAEVVAPKRLLPVLEPDVMLPKRLFCPPLCPDDALLFAPPPPKLNPPDIVSKCSAVCRESGKSTIVLNENINS